jgi:hypothetical protein
MNCETANILVLFSRPLGKSDLAPEEAQALASHLSSCPACAAAAEKQRATDEAIGRAFRDVPVPAGLSEKLLREAYAKQGAALRRKIYLTIAAGAFVVAGGFAGYLVHWATRPHLDTNQLLDQLQYDLENPEAATLAWLKSEGLPQQLPEAFDFRLLTSKGRTELQGARVPCLTFQAWRQGEPRPDTAKVFILSREQFKLYSLQEGQNSFGTLRVVPDDGRGWAFVFVHTANLELFLKPNFKQVTRL